MKKKTNQKPDLKEMRLALEAARIDLREALRIHIQSAAYSDAELLQLAGEYDSLQKPTCG